MNLLVCDHKKPVLKRLHWLPVEHRNTYKLCFLMYVIHNGMDKPRSIWQTAYLQSLQLTADTGWGQLTQRIAFCRELEPNSESLVSAAVVQPPGTVFLLTCMTLLTLIRLKDGWCLSMTIVQVPYKSHIELELDKRLFGGECVGALNRPDALFVIQPRVSKH